LEVFARLGHSFILVGVGLKKATKKIKGGAKLNLLVGSKGL
jgi:hypothetical protein